MAATGILDVSCSHVAINTLRVGSLPLISLRLQLPLTDGNGAPGNALTVQLRREAAASLVVGPDQPYWRVRTSPHGADLATEVHARYAYETVRRVVDFCHSPFVRNLSSFPSEILPSHTAARPHKRTAGGEDAQIIGALVSALVGAGWARPAAVDARVQVEVPRLVIVGSGVEGLAWVLPTPNAPSHRGAVAQTVADRVSCGNHADLTFKRVHLRQRQGVVAAGWPGSVRNALDRERILLALLAGMERSVLNQALRRNAQLVYNLVPKSQAGPRGVTSIVAACAPEKVDQVARLATAALRDFFSSPPNDEAVERAKGYVSAIRADALASPPAVADALLRDRSQDPLKSVAAISHIPATDVDQRRREIRANPIAVVSSSIDV